MTIEKQRLTGDLIRLSDMFRRNATFDKHAQATDLVNKSREIAVLTTHFYGEYPFDHWANKQLKDAIAPKLQELADLAKQAGLTKVTLPFVLQAQTGEVNLFAKWLQEMVLDQETFALPVSLRTKEYGTDLSKKFGQVNRSLPTFFDEGVRGVLDVSSDAAYYGM